MNIRKHGFSTSLSSARPGSDDSTGPPALRCSWTTVTDSELRLHRAQVGSLFWMFFYAFVRKIPIGYGMTHAAVYGDFLLTFYSHSFVASSQMEYPASRAISFTYGIGLSVAAAMLSIGMFSLSRFMITVLPFSPCLSRFLPACLQFYTFGVPSKVSYILASFLYVL